MARKVRKPLRRIKLVTVEHEENAADRIGEGEVNSSLKTARLLHEWLGKKDREHFVVFHLDARNRMVSREVISVGSLMASLVHPREVFKGALLASAAAIVCGHNHPSGNAAVSQEDVAITKRLIDAGRILGIEVLDHVIVGPAGADGTYTSMLDTEGHLWK